MDNLEQRIRKTLGAKLPEWAYSLKKGDEFIEYPYMGSWNPPGTKTFRVVKFVCITSDYEVMCFNPVYANSTTMNNLACLHIAYKIGPISDLEMEEGALAREIEQFSDPDEKKVLASD